MNKPNDEIKYVIEPKKYGADYKLVWVITLTWLIWMPLTLYGTYYTYTNYSFSINNILIYVFLALGHVGIFFFPYAIYSKNRIQTLLIEGDKLIVFGAEILPKTKVEIRKDNLKSLTFIREIVDNEKVFNRTLQLNYLMNDKTEYVSLAHLINPNDQLIIFEEIRQFLNENGFTFETKIELPIGNDSE